MPTIEQSGLLSGLVQGFTKAKTEMAQQEIASRAAQREDILKYLHIMATDPRVPPEHQQWALQGMQQFVQTDPTKKLPKLDFTTLPPAQSTRQTTSQTPAMTLQPPQPPGGAQGPAQAQTPPQGAGNEVGRAPNGQVNALGQAPAAIAPPQPPQIGGALPPVSLPAGPATTVQNTQQFAPGGQPHIMDPAEMQTRGLILPPKPVDAFTLTPGEERFEGGRKVAENTQAKPGTKSGFSYERGPGGESLIKENASGRTLSEAEVNANPEAKAIYDTGEKAVKAANDRADEKQRKTFEQQAKMAETAMDNALKKQDHSAAVKAHDDAFKDWNDAQNRVHVMDQNLVKAKQGDQQAMLSLLTNHVGMTQGAQKGARITQAILNEAQSSAPWLQKVEAKFSPDGYLSGVTLTPEQMDQMVGLAHEKADIAKQSYDRVGEHYSEELNLGKSGKVKPPKAPSAETPQAGGFDWNAHPVVNQPQP
jgi:hypothetical protein